MTLNAPEQVDFRQSAFAVTGILAAIATVVLVGWALNIAAMQAIIPGFGVMTPVTAVLFLLTVIVINLRLRQPDSLRLNQFADITTLLILGLSLAAFISYLGSENFRFVHLLTRHSNAIESGTSPGVLTGFLLTGVALAIYRARPDVDDRIPRSYALGVGLISYFVLLRYIIGLQNLGTVFSVPQMPLITALGFQLLSISMLMASPGQRNSIPYQRSAAGTLFRLLIPVALVAPVLTFWLETRLYMIDVIPSEIEPILRPLVDMLLLVCVALLAARLINRGDRDRQKAAQDLYESEARFRAIVENVPSGFALMFDHNLRYLVAGGSVLDEIGLGASGMVGKTLFEVAPEPRVHALEKLYRSALAGVAGKLEITAFEREFVANAVPIFNEAGQIDAGLVMVLDVTERKASERRLSESNAQLRSIIRNYPNGTAMLFDKDLTIMIVDGADQQSREWKVQDLEGKSYAEVHEKYFTHDFEAQYRAAVRGETFETEISRDGKCISFQVGPVRNIAGDIIGGLAVAQDITQRKANEERLHRLNTQLESMIRNFPNGALLLYDRDLRYQVADGLSLAAIGVNSRDFIGKTFYEVSSDEMIRLREPAYLAALAGETTISEHNSNNRTYLTHTNPVRDAAGEIIGGLVISQDITERKQQERELRNLNAQLRSILQNFPNGAVMLFDHDLRYLVSSGQGAEPFDLDRNTLVGKTLQDAYPADFVKLREASYRAALKGIASREEVIYGGRAYLAFTVPVEDEHNEVIAGLVMTQDITERKRNEDRIRELNAQLRTVLSNFPNGVVMLYDRDLRYQVVDGMALETMGLSTPELEGQLLSDVSPPDLYALRAPIYRAALDGRGTISEHQYSGRIFETHTNPVTDEDGKVVAGMVTSLDVTDRRNYEIELQRLNEQLTKYTQDLERSNTELKQFAYVASHDLQEPLRTVSSFLQLLDNRYSDQLDDKARQYIGFAVDGAHRMRQLITDMLEYSRVESRGGLFGTIDMASALEKALDNLRIQIEETDSIISHDPLPIIYADATQIVQLLQNLISNAIKFQGEATPEVRLTVACTGEFWRFAVHDNGIGISPKYNEQIYDIFQRLHTKETYPGTGIGLALCKRIVERHGGEIWHESEPGHGTIFFFTLPTSGEHPCE